MITKAAKILFLILAMSTIVLIIYQRNIYDEKRLAKQEFESYAHENKLDSDAFSGPILIQIKRNESVFQWKVKKENNVTVLNVSVPHNILPPGFGILTVWGEGDITHSTKE